MLQCFTLMIYLYRVLSSSTNITTARAWGFCDRRSIIRSKSFGLECRDTFSDTATHMPKSCAIEMNDAIPWNEILLIVVK